MIRFETRPGHPLPREIRRARTHSGLTQQKAAELVSVKRRTWQDWELGASPMNPTLFRAFLHLTGQREIKFEPQSDE